MHINYTDVVSSRSQITSRIPMRYTPGRSWESVRERRVLSLGCGPVEGSQFKELLASAAGVEGVDTDPKTGALYRTLAEVPSGEFTSLVAEHVLEHMTHDQILDAFEQAARILSPGSTVIITLPNINNFGIWFGDHDHKSFCPPVDTASMLELHGFHVADMFGWSKQSRFQRHMSMSEQECAIARFVEENWGLTLPQYITIYAVRS